MDIQGYAQAWCWLNGTWKLTVIWLSSMWHIVNEKLSVCLKVIMSHTFNIKYIKCFIEEVTPPSGAVGSGNKDILCATVMMQGQLWLPVFPHWLQHSSGNYNGQPWVHDTSLIHHIQRVMMPKQRVTEPRGVRQAGAALFGPQAKSAWGQNQGQRSHRIGVSNHISSRENRTVFWERLCTKCPYALVHLFIPGVVGCLYCFQGDWYKRGLKELNVNCPMVQTYESRNWNSNSVCGFRADRHWYQVQPIKLKSRIWVRNRKI